MNFLHSSICSRIKQLSIMQIWLWCFSVSNPPLALLCVQGKTTCLAWYMKLTMRSYSSFPLSTSLLTVVLLNFLWIAYLLFHLLIHVCTLFHLPGIPLHPFHQANSFYFFTLCLVITSKISSLAQPGQLSNCGLLTRASTPSKKLLGIHILGPHPRISKGRA